ncbi:MAG: mammalian cell entry protein [Mycobacterium sp.]
MSPRRKVDSAERFVAGDFFKPAPSQSSSRGLVIIAGVATVLVLLAVAGSTFMAARHEQDSQRAARAATVLGYVKTFMTKFATLDPYHANAYGDLILAEATGDFAKQYQDRIDQILIQVAQAQPTQGTVEAAGVQRWNEDGGADVLIAMKVTTTTADGKSTVESGSRWVVTASQEGQQWKISRLNQVT